MPSPGASHPQPLQALAGFAAHLRAHGYRVGIPEQQGMVQAALTLDLAEYPRLEACWRSLVCGAPGEWRRFPEIFQGYWFPDRLKGQVRVSGQLPPRRDLRQAVAALKSAAEGDAPGAKATADAGAGDGGETAIPDAGHAQGGASRVEARERRPFQDWGADDMARLERLVEAVARRLRARLTRRRRFDARGRLLDLRRTLRRSLRTGGVPFEPAWLKRRTERPRFFILVDVSRSMELYARLFLSVARAFAAVLRARVFVFHTRIAEVTPLLLRPSGRVQEKINAVTAGFGGGTRIAASLADFVRVHARGALSRSARVVIMSDGFDSDGADALAAQLAAVRDRGAAIYWLHPTAEPPRSAALAPCAWMVRAFAPVHNLQSLSNLDVLIR